MVPFPEDRPEGVDPGPRIEPGSSPNRKRLVKLPGVAVSGDFFSHDAQEVARALLGKVLCHRVDGLWLAARIIEAEAYYLAEKGSHASLGFTEKRKALFMPPGTIYMYYARGGDSFNVSCLGEGNAVLVKAGIPHPLGESPGPMLARMAGLNPLPSGAPRAGDRLCAGQTLLCRALGLRVPDWDQRGFDGKTLQLLDVGYRPADIIRTTRLGIPPGRDGHLPYRFIDPAHVRQCTRNPMTRRGGGAPEYEIIPA